MKRILNIQVTIVLVTLTISFISCRKEDDFLSAKSNQSLAIPTLIGDLQLILNNESLFNRNYPALGETSTDDMMLDLSTWQSSTPTDRNAFTWAQVVYPAGASVNDWNAPYQMIFNTNIILQNLDKLTGDNQSDQYRTIKGGALFFRSIAYFNLLQVFTLPYNPASAANDLGVPMPLVPQLNVKLPRLTQEVCYAKIIEDLTLTLSLLPDLPAKKTAPSRVAALALLSRIYMVMQNYPRAIESATAALVLYHQLQDLNRITSVARPVYPNFSPEEVFHASMINYTSNGRNSQVAADLYALFNDPNDLRLRVYFRTATGKSYFNSQYDQKSNLTYALTTAELLLNKAECEARAGDVTTAMADLNMLLVTRWRAGTYKVLSAKDQAEALTLILKERRKELALTGVRWYDLRRLNQTPAYATTLTRIIGTERYTLMPNTIRYALPISENEIQSNNIDQNQR